MKIEIELWQRGNKLLWQRMEGIVNTETQEEIERKKEFHREIDKIGNLPKPNELGQGTSRQHTETIQPDLEKLHLKMQKRCHPIRKTQSRYRRIISPVSESNRCQIY